VALHQLYTNISKFIKSSHTITPHFDTAKADWSSFASLQNSVLSQAQSYRQNPLFKEMENVPGFKSGLDDATLKQKTGSQRPAFYRQLSQQIISYFNSVEPTPDKVNLLNQIYKNYVNEESSIGVAALAELKVSYGS
jgi:hypothetical protein